VRGLFETRVAARHPNVPFQVFHSRLRSQCRLYLRKNPAA
jgi:hypothetical protein